MTLIKLASILLLALVFAEDLRHRAVHWALFPLLLITLAIPAVREQPFGAWAASAVLNAGFVVLQLGAGLALVMLRQGQWRAPFTHLIGLGDVLFLLVVACGLSTERFIPYYITGLIATLLGHLLLRWSRPSAAPTVPTAGLLALWLAGWIALEQLGVLGALHRGAFAHSLLVHG